MASSAGQQLLALIGDILDIARIESGHLSLMPERANLHALVVSVCRVFEGLARQKNLLWRIELDEHSDRDVLIDPTRFKQVLSNLLSNAIKFTHKGEVSLKLQVVPVSPDRVTVNVCIEDSGSGISDFDQQRLFSPFVQVGNRQVSGRQGLRPGAGDQPHAVRNDGRAIATRQCPGARYPFGHQPGTAGIGGVARR